MFVNIHLHNFTITFCAVMGHFIFGRQTHGHQNDGHPKMDLSRLVNPL